MGWRSSVLAGELEGSVMDFGTIPTTPLSTFAPETNIARVFVQRNFAYICEDDPTNKLKIIDCTDPENPLLVGEIVTAVRSDNVNVHGDYCYITTRVVNNGQLEIYNISDPANPVLTGTLTGGTFSAPSKLKIKDNIAYLLSAGIGGGLNTIDVSDPSNPVLLGYVDIGTTAQGLDVQGNFAYAADTGGLFRTVDISDPINPTIVGTLAIGGAPYEVYVSGNYAYLGRDSSNQLSIIDISDSTAPSLVSTISTKTFPDFIFVQNNLCYVSCVSSSNAIQIFNVEDPTTPVLLGEISTPAKPVEIFIQGNILYAAIVNTGLVLYKIGSSYIQALEAGSIEAESLSTRGKISVGQDADIKGSLNTGRGIKSQGDVKSEKKVQATEEIIVYEPSFDPAKNVKIILQKLLTDGTKQNVAELLASWGGLAGNNVAGTELSFLNFYFWNNGTLERKFAISGLGVSVGDGGGLLRKIFSKIENLNFPSTDAGNVSTINVNVPGAVVDDLVLTSMPNTAVAGFAANSSYKVEGIVTAADTVTMKFQNLNAIASLNPAAADFKILVVKL